MTTHYANCVDVNSRQNIKFKMKYLVKKALQCQKTPCITVFKVRLHNAMNFMQLKTNLSMQFNRSSRSQLGHVMTFVQLITNFLKRQYTIS